MPVEIEMMSERSGLLLTHVSVKSEISVKY